MAEAGRGRFVWHELMTTDSKKAQEFYTKITGWGTQPFGDAYTMWTVDGVPIGGVMNLPEPGAPLAWLGYISVPDVQAASNKVTSLGGKVVKQPADIPNVGTFSIVADPQGAMFCLFKSAQDRPFEDRDPKIGEFSWQELATSDWAAAWKFYENLFGWEKRAEHDMGPMGVYMLFGIAGREAGGMFTRPKEMPGGPAWLYYVRVPDSDRAAELVKQHGGQVLHGPTDVPGGDRIVQCLDPQGAAFAVHSRKA